MFSTYLEGKTNIKHGEINGKALVLGWMTTNLDAPASDNSPLLETRFALHVDGRMMKTEPERYGVSYFNKPGLVWHEVTEIPSNAEFIGNYVDDMFSK